VEVLVLQVFVSLLLVAGSLLLFGYSVRQRTHEHSDRLALAPLDDDDNNNVESGSEPERNKTNDPPAESEGLR
jgi:hypothetical protein